MFQRKLLSLKCPAIFQSLSQTPRWEGFLGLISVQAVGNCGYDFQASACLGRQTPKMHAALAPEYIDTTAWIHQASNFFYDAIFHCAPFIQHVRGERGQVELLGEGDGDDDALLLGRGQRRTRHLLPHLQARRACNKNLSLMCWSVFKWSQELFHYMCALVRPLINQLKGYISLSKAMDRLIFTSHFSSPRLCCCCNNLFGMFSWPTSPNWMQKHHE